MKLSKKWLQDFINIDIPDKDFADLMTMSGSKVEEIKYQKGLINKIIVGKITGIDKHPNADKLLICKVDIGNKDSIQIVTSAKNITLGAIVPVAIHGATLADGTRIFKSSLRGVESDGMFCSLKELALTKNDFPYADENGIFIIKENCSIGQDICSAIGLDDVCFEFEITPNRPDCLSVIGLAREAAATMKKDLHLKPTYQIHKNYLNINTSLNVTVQDKNLCSAYCAAVVSNVKVQPSPRWIRERLRCMGVRPINNIVDITNFVMLETGQPMHAYDLCNIQNNQIFIRKAIPNETITTLDGSKRTLTSEQLIIADSLKPISIAGVMGGEFSSINENTNTIVFESAHFDANSIRTTSSYHGLRTEASSRYEKGLDPNSCLTALYRACQLIELLDAGTLDENLIVNEFFDKKLNKIPLDIDFINNFLNLQLTSEEIKTILERIGCTFSDHYIIIPSFRSDLQCQADIAEEVARFYGYNNIKTTLFNGFSIGGYTRKQKWTNELKDILKALGLSEIITYSFMDPDDFDKILISKSSPLRDSIKILNPIGKETSIMRTTLLPSMLEVLKNNYNNRNLSCNLFEIGKTYIRSTEEDLPKEINSLAIGMYGPNTDFFSIKGVLEALLYYFNIKNYDVRSTDQNPTFHSGRCAELLIDGHLTGVFGELHPLVCEKYKLPDLRLYLMEINTDLLYSFCHSQISYKPLPKFPSVYRDIAIVCSQEIPMITLQHLISDAIGEYLEEICLFDVYKGTQIAKNKKSLAFKLKLRSQDGTLNENQINQLINKAVQSLETVGATIR